MDFFTQELPDFVPAAVSVEFSLVSVIAISSDPGTVMTTLQDTAIYSSLTFNAAF